MGTVLLVWLLVVVIGSAVWEVWQVFLMHSDVTSKAWQEHHRRLREQLEHNPSGHRQDTFKRRLAQADAYASKHQQAPERFLDATTAREVRLWQQQQALARAQTHDAYQQRLRPRASDTINNDIINE